MTNEELKQQALQYAETLISSVDALKRQCDAILSTGDSSASLALTEATYTRTRQQIKRLVADIAISRTAMFQELDDVLTPTLIDLGHQAGVVLAKQLGTAQPTLEEIQRALQFEPMLGVLYREWFAKIRLTDYEKIRASLRMALVNGSTALEALHALKGTQRNSYRDGVLRQAHNSVASLVATATNHIVNVSRLLAIRNAGVPKWQLVSVEDHSEMCAAAQGVNYDYGSGPRPPLHIGCRSLVAPVLE